MDKLKLTRDFLDTQIHMIIATTAKNGKPEAALVGFAADTDLSLIFGTYTATRKYLNVQCNPNLAAVFGNREGIISTLAGDELARYKDIYFKKTPSSKISADSSSFSSFLRDTRKEKSMFFRN